MVTGLDECIDLTQKARHALGRSVLECLRVGDSEGVRVLSALRDDLARAVMKANATLQERAAKAGE